VIAPATPADEIGLLKKENEELRQLNRLLALKVEKLERRLWSPKSERYLADDTSGRDAAIVWLTERIERFPHFVPLRRLLLEWRRTDSPALALEDIGHYLSHYPDDSWALRDKALILVCALRPDEALVAGMRGEELEPNVPTSPGIVGYALLALRRFDEAQAATK
jgi:hypothetical protein